jgi:hypothetical protein
MATPLNANAHGRKTAPRNIQASAPTGIAPDEPLQWIARGHDDLFDTGTGPAALTWIDQQQVVDQIGSIGRYAAVARTTDVDADAQGAVGSHILTWLLRNRI